MRIELRCDRLPDRDAPSTVNLDFSQFGSIFRGYSRSLDFDRNRRVNRRDLLRAQQQVAARLAVYLPGYTVTINAGPGSHNVVFAGRAEPGVLGRAFLAPPGRNHAGPASVFVDEVWDTLRGYRPSPAQLAQAFAQIAAHEVGHLLGLPHSERGLMGAYYIPLVVTDFNSEQYEEVLKSRDQENYA